MTRQVSCERTIPQHRKSLDASRWIEANRPQENCQMETKYES